MRIPIIKGTIKRRLLVNYRADAALVKQILPNPFRPKLHQGFSVIGICLIRLEGMRPSGMPSLLGFSSENAAHRIAVEWTDNMGAQQEGVFIPRRDTGAKLNQIAGGRIFPGEHHASTFSIVDHCGHVDFRMRSNDVSVEIRLAGDEVDSLPASSIFGSLDEASVFFERGSLGYSVTRDCERLDGLQLCTLDWRVRALSVTEIYSSYFADRKRFPENSVTFDHALVMRDIDHEWHKAEDLQTNNYTSARCSFKS